MYNINIFNIYYLIVFILQHTLPFHNFLAKVLHLFVFQGQVIKRYQVNIVSPSAFVFFLSLFSRFTVISCSYAYTDLHFISGAIWIPLIFFSKINDKELLYYAYVTSHRTYWLRIYYKSLHLFCESKASSRNIKLNEICSQETDK